MDKTILLCILFPLVTILNSYCLGKVFSVYFRRYRTMECHSFAVGFAAYVGICLASVFFFVFIPIPYGILVYVLIAVQCLLVFTYVWHWRAVYAFIWNGWRSALGFALLVLLFYGLAVLLGVTPANEDGSSVIASQSVQTDAANAGFRFQTWQKFLNCWVLITGGDYRTFSAYSTLFVMVVPAAAVVHRMIASAGHFKSGVAAFLLLTAGFSAAVWRFAPAGISAQLIPLVLLMILEIRDYFSRDTGRSTATVTILASLAGFSMSKDFFYLALCVVWGLVFAMGLRKDSTVGSHFYRTLSGSTLLVSMYVFDTSVPAAAVLFFVGLAATIMHILLISAGRDAHVRFISRLITGKAKVILMLLFLASTGVALLLAVLNGFEKLDYSIYGPTILLGEAGAGANHSAYWVLVGLVYAVAWLCCFYAVFIGKGKSAGIWAFGGLVLANPFLVMALAGLAGRSDLILAYFVPTVLLLTALYDWCVNRKDWWGVAVAVLICAATVGVLTYEEVPALKLMDWRFRAKVDATPASAVNVASISRPAI